MSLFSAGRVLLIAVLCLSGLLNLFWTVSRRRSAAEMRGCLFACAAFLLLAGALWAQAGRQNGLALAAGALAAFSALGWFYHIYKQSLHNTAM